MNASTEQPWRARLRESGKTKFAVCTEAGLNPAYLTQILETKSATPRIDNLGRIAAVLGTSVSYLVEGVDAAAVVGDLERLRADYERLGLLVSEAFFEGHAKAARDGGVDDDHLKEFVERFTGPAWDASRARQLVAQLQPEQRETEARS